MNFIEFNLPKVMKPYLDSIVKYRGVYDYKYSKGKLRLTGTFTPKVIEAKISKLYQKIYEEEIKEEIAKVKQLNKMMSKAVKKGIKRYKAK